MSESTARSVIAIVGASGTLGAYIFYQLKHSPYDFEIRTLSRKLTPPKGGDKQNHCQVDFNNVKQLEEALKGCNFLVNCMGTEGAYHAAKVNLVHAAAAVGVFGYITSDFGVDYNFPGKHFDHPCWHEKRDHIEYSKKQGLRTIAIFPGLFQEAPFGAFGPWHGFDPETRTFVVAGTGHEPITTSSKLDIGSAVARICHLVLSTEDTKDKPPTQPLAGKDYIRIASHSITPYEVIKVIHAHGETENKTSGDDRSKDWKVDALTTEEMRAKFQSTMKLVVMDDVARAALGPEFDIEFANEIAGRVFRAMGDGSLHFKTNDNELLNPGQKYWKWRSVSNFERDTIPKALF